MFKTITGKKIYNLTGSPIRIMAVLSLSTPMGLLHQPVGATGKR